MQAITSGRVDATPVDPEGLLAAVANGHAVRAVSAPGARISYMVAVRKEINRFRSARQTVRHFAAGALFRNT